MRSDDHLSGRITAFIGKLKDALPGTDAAYNKWVALHYPKHTCVLMQQRMRVIGIALACYTKATQVTPDEDQVRRVITWANRNPFNVVDEHIAMELFVRFHSNVPVHYTVTTSSPRHCLKFSYPLVNPNLVGK
ncbi:hypothetical protein pEaSNUABM37_00028 [Erwinia phage pEa_SNUABM_37]|nr:hypothetical protein pEaSNUABM37_00028 [Erwinia phage pEa_SNUABM_37]QXO10498.1 hypothetical protein pEaSNUABM48_00028 [Erwinia phage pEa_SNUABM_48]